MSQHTVNRFNIAKSST